MKLFQCLNCEKDDCQKCPQALSVPLLIEGHNYFESTERLPNKLFKIGNVVYYHYDKKFSTKINEKQQLINFPDINLWKAWNLNNCQVKVVLRDYEDNKEYKIKCQLKIYDDILTIFPNDKESFFCNIIGNEVTWQVEKTFHFIYIACEELCFLTHKIMHDPSLFVDIKKNKIGVTNPLPPLPDNLSLNYVLKLRQGKMEWVIDKEKKEDR